MIESQGDIIVWDLDEWCQKQKIYEKNNEIETLDFSHDGKIFATAGKVNFLSRDTCLLQYCRLCIYLCNYAEPMVVLYLIALQVSYSYCFNHCYRTGKFVSMTATTYK